MKKYSITLLILTAAANSYCESTFESAKNLIIGHPKTSIAAATVVGGYALAPRYAKIFMNNLGYGFTKGLFLPNANLETTWEPIYSQNEYIWTDANALGIHLKNNFTGNIFLFGVSSSGYQIEGGFDNVTWTNPKTGLVEPANASDRFYKTHKCVIDEKGKQRFLALEEGDEHIPTPGMAINFWQNYKKIIPQMKRELGINSFRLSIEWSRVFPSANILYCQQDACDLNKAGKPGLCNPRLDVNALNTYKDIIKTLKKYNIEPIVVFHHYTVPSWFEDLGGFEKEENIKSFVDFCTTMFNALCEDVAYWSTYNAIEGYAFKGYFIGEGAPGIKGDMEMTARVMAHMLEAHVRVYQEINKLYQEKLQNGANIPKPLIGIQKNIHQLDIARNSTKQMLLSPITGICAGMGAMLQDEGFYNFFTTGTFELWVPGKFKTAVKMVDLNAPNCLDWIGINTYSNTHMFIQDRGHKYEPYSQDRITLNGNYRFYPEGIYRAIKEIDTRMVQPIAKKADKNIPIIVAENGIALGDNNDDRRKEYFQKALFTIGQALKDGYNVIGYLPWSSHDNYEWRSVKGTKRYGMFHVDFSDKENPKITGLKESSLVYRDVIKAFYQ